MTNKLMLAAALLATQCATAQTYVTQVKPAGTKLWGYTNIKGEILIQPQYEKCYRFSPEGLAAIYDRDQRQYHFINLKNEKLAVEAAGFKIKDGLGFDVAGFKDGLALIKKGEKWGYINTMGKVVIEAKYDDGCDFDEGVAYVKLGGKYFIINKQGTEMPVAADATDVRDFTEGMAPYRAADKKFGFINAEGKVAIPAQFESVGYFKNGLAWAKINDGLLGYINPKGEWVIKPQFNSGKEFDKESGLARVKNGERWAYVNRQGEILDINDTDVWGDFSEGLCDGRKNGKKGFYDNKGNWVIAPQFDGVRDFKNGYAAAKMGDKWGLIDKTGKWILQPQFDGIKDMEIIK